MLSNRTKISLAQFLALQTDGAIALLCEKHGVEAPRFDYFPDRLSAFRGWLSKATEDPVMAILDEIIRTHSTVRAHVSPKYMFDERWEDLVRCLKLDGYHIDMSARTIRPVDPTIPAALPIEDDLTAEVGKSQLPEAAQIVSLLEKSGAAFRQSPPDFNGCLSNARIALETLARAIAKKRRESHPGSFDETKWGQVLAYLRTSGLLSKQEEEGLAGVYGFVSPGAHTPLGLTEEEMVRLGRSLVASMAYFLTKRFNG